MRKITLLTILVLVLLSVFGVGALAQELIIEEKQAAQAEIEASIAQELQAAEYTLEDPFVLLDPYGESPLTAIIAFNTAEAAKVQVTVVGKDVYTTVTHEFAELATQHVLPIYGLYAGHDNEVVLDVQTEAGESLSHTVTVTTEPLPEDILNVAIKVSQPEKMADGFTFFSMAGAGFNYPNAIDANGDVRWYLLDKNLGSSINMVNLQNGNLIVGSGKMIPDSYINQTSIYEITLLGKFVKEFEIYSVHHDIKEKPNGNLIVAASKEGRDTINDYIVEIDRASGEVVNSWDMQEILPMTTYAPEAQYTDPTNWFHHNGSWYIPEEDALVVSGRTQDMIAKFSMADNQLIWAFAAHSAESNEKLVPFMLTPTHDDLEYPTAQHASMILPDGRLFLFDNGNFVEAPAEGEEADQSLFYSRAVIYSIDEENKTITQDWQWGKDRRDIYSSYVSDVDYLGENHYLIDFGGTFRAADGTVADFVMTPFQDLYTEKYAQVSTIVEVLNDEVVFEMELFSANSAHTYKAERHNIYAGVTAIELK